MHSDFLATVFGPTECGPRPIADEAEGGGDHSSWLAHVCDTTMVQEVAAINDTRAGAHSRETGQDKDTREVGQSAEIT